MVGGFFEQRGVLKGITQANGRDQNRERYAWKHDYAQRGKGKGKGKDK